jgi:two-component system, chemotaxis family, protein-glutamate methylesterase/glutaminase
VSRAAADAVVSVLIVDDSPVQRRFLRAAIDADPGFRVVGEARNGREAVALVERLRPAVVLMDLDLPVMNGIEAIERIMATRPTPIVVYSAYVDGSDSPNALAATAAGAVDIAAKPAPGDHLALDGYARDLRGRLKVASRARVITHPRGRLRQSGFTKTANGNDVVTSKRPTADDAPVKPAPIPDRIESLRDPVRLVVIGASTGGPQALAQLFTSLPASFEPAVLVVQHMADGFIESLAAWLDEMSPLSVSVGESGRRLEPGTVTVAPSGLNLIVHDRRLRVTCERPPTTQFHVPGIDATFRSVADSVGSDAIGVLLTGMGRDGAVGLKAMHDRGATTIAQDESTSAVYGMPAAAEAIGAVDFGLPLPAIAPALLTLVGHDESEQQAQGARA